MNIIYDDHLHEKTWQLNFTFTAATLLTHIDIRLSLAI